MQEGVESQQSNNYSVDNEVVIFGEDDTLQQQAGATNSKTQNRQGKMKNRRTYVGMKTKKHEIHHLQDEQGDKFSLQTQIHFQMKQGNLDTTETDKVKDMLIQHLAINIL